MNKLASSFRDPSGFMFSADGAVCRQINPVAKQDYELLMSSGLYGYLVERELLIAHSETESLNEDAYKTIRPELIPFISYPYEWSFEQLKDAALLTLRIQKVALRHGMSLKDASAYNIQFYRGKAIFIDTLSFERQKEQRPWDAYRQFCQHFLAPLSLASYRDIRLTGLLSDFIDGIPLDLAARLLPRRTKLRFSLLSHIHLHAKAQGKHADRAADHRENAKVSRTGMLGIIDNLRSAIRNLRWNSGDTEWGDYYNNTNYSDSSFAEKKSIIEEFLTETEARTLWDLGANDGTFSSIGAKMGIDTVAFDIDPAAVNKNYIRVKKDKETRLLPILMDLTNPSSGLGWAHEERDSLQARGKADCAMALALVHHLALSNNLPLQLIADYFSKLGDYLIIEFVPKSDSKVQTLLATRKDIFPEYTAQGFERAFETRYAPVRKRAISGSGRILYLYKVKQ